MKQDQPQIIFNIATVERRKKIFLGVLKCLRDQTVPCDHINVAMSYKEMDIEVFDFIKDSFKSFHILCKPKMSAEIKMYNFDKAPDNSYFVTFDDDIIYPQNYFEKMRLQLVKDSFRSVIGYHGIWFDRFPVTDYFRQRKIYQYFLDVREDQAVHVIGTGCCGFYTKTLRDAGFKFSHFEKFPEYGNFNDMVFAEWLRKTGIPMKVCAHTRGWMQIYPQSQDEHALWKQSKIGGKITELLFLQS